MDKIAACILFLPPSHGAIVYKDPVNGTDTPVDELHADDKVCVVGFDKNWIRIEYRHGDAKKSGWVRIGQGME
jgi:hypothetical protein